MHGERIVGFVAFAAIACSRPAQEIGPAPEPSHAPAPPAPEPKAIVRDVRCTYGGRPRPRFFVWLDLEARASLRSLHATSFTLGDSGGAFVDAVERSIGSGHTLRTRTDGGRGPVPAEMSAAERLQLELFGPLRGAAFGAGATHPTEERPFRARIEADGGVELTLEGTCVLAPGEAG